MKLKDIAVIVVVGVISAIISFVISSKIFVNAGDRQQKVVTVDVIKSDFQQPSSRYFNSDSIDAAQLVQIGNNNNQNPFSGQ